MKKVMTFKKGDKVKWTSQSSGYWKTKEGIISALVPAGQSALSYGYKPNGGPPGSPRNYTSYVVMVGARSYWPRISQLERMK
jgi:hypothetical protein